MDIFLKNHLAELLCNKNVGRKYLLERMKDKNIRFKKDISFIERLKDLGIEVISYDQKEYPPMLRKIHDFPVLLFLKGNKELLKMNMLAVVGTRSMTEYGKRIVNMILDKNRDMCIVSGLARGVDSEVHKVCIKRGIQTIAVTAGGMNYGFPECNRNVFESICKEGLIVSEFPPGREIIKGMFPMRNRILTGMSFAVIIIESGIKGGSMITANLALEQGKEVFAVPGEILSTASQGCNLLISQGSNIVLDKENLYILLNDIVHTLSM